MDEKKYLLVFDLDDTLYKEVDFLRSGYQYICDKFLLDEHVFQQMLKNYFEGKNAFEELIRQHDLPLQLSELIQLYHAHLPKISLDQATKYTLDVLSQTPFVELGLLTDGRSTTQRNKLKALGIENYFKEIIISEEFGSEKPNLANYLHFANKYPNYLCFYIADNIQKDFVSPNQLAWTTICLKDNGRNVHSQCLSVSSHFLPKHLITEMAELISIIID
jgi:putative hydrolase of the HAD superfamily